MKSRMTWYILSAAILLFPWASPVRVMALHLNVHGTWTVAANMLAPVMGHHAVMLQDGRVLVVGGEPEIGQPVSLAQVYDPSLQTWSAAANMHSPRIGESVTVLRDGRVLVVGGLGRSLQDLNSAEVLDSAGSAWKMLPPLPQSRFSQSANVLPDGTVMLAGGIVDGHISRSTLIFDPIRDVFRPGPSMHFNHALQSSSILRGGSVLIAGGFGGRPEIYDPSSRSWKAIAPIPLRINHIMTTLRDGRVLLASGTSSRVRDVSSAYLLDPVSKAWSTTGPLFDRRNAATAALLPDGRVLVAGGEQVTGKILGSAAIYDPVLGKWTRTDDLHVPRAGATGTVLRDGTVLVCGGTDFDGPLASCEQYHP